MKTGRILYPKDKEGGGTWFALHENGNAMVFLNGGKVNHIPSPPYRRSRGLVLLDLLDSESPLANFLAINLNEIEPFTAVIWEDKKLFEFSWDNYRKCHLQLNAAIPHIWSSVTLYDENIRNKRRQWFNNWFDKNPFPSIDDILNFHQFSGEGDSRNDILMNRDGLVSTVSITALEFTEDNGFLTYFDIKSRQSWVHKLVFTKITAEK